MHSIRPNLHPRNQARHRHRDPAVGRAQSLLFASSELQVQGTHPLRVDYVREPREGAMAEFPMTPKPHARHVDDYKVQQQNIQVNLFRNTM